MIYLGQCPWVEYPEIEWNGAVRIMHCVQVNSPQLHYEKRDTGLSYVNLDNFLYLNDKFTSCSCASPMCSWYECDNFTASQKFRIYNVFPNVPYNVRLCYDITLTELAAAACKLPHFAKVSTRS